MDNEVSTAQITGRDLTFSAVQPVGTLRGDAGQTLAETAVSGYYKATPSTTLVAGDRIVIYDSVLGVIGGGEYLPDVTTTALSVELALVDGKIDDIQGAGFATGTDDLKTLSDNIDVIDANVDTILSDGSGVTNVYNETGVAPSSEIPIIVYK